MGIVVRHIKRFLLFTQNRPLQYLRFFQVLPFPTTYSTKANAICQSYHRNGPRKRYVVVSVLSSFPELTAPSCKPADRSSNPSPDMPNKKPRLVERAIIAYGEGAMLMLNRHMVPETSTVTLPHEVLKSSGNGTTLSQVNLATIVEQPTSTSGLYTSEVKDLASLKLPQLPRGENVAIATNPAGAR